MPGLGVSPKEVNVSGMGVHPHPIKGGDSPPTDMATKQYVHPSDLEKFQYPLSPPRALLANEKRRRRRESHNAVERRRRDNINEKISELATLIPECLLDPTATPSALAVPNQFEGTSDEMLLGTSPTAMVEKKEEEDTKDINAGMGKDGGKDSEGTNGGVKANKGMILRKSVEYIRFVTSLTRSRWCLLIF